MKEERIKRMGTVIAQRQSMTMEDLCKEFQVSINTVRSDVAYLVKTGAVEKIYGGVRAVVHKQVPLFTSRAMLCPDEKQRIASQAEKLVEDKDIIFVDAGTTTMHMIDCLDPVKHVTIVTANLYVIQKAYDHENVELIALPGTLNRRTNSVSDVSSLECLSRYQFNKAFMGVSGVSEDGWLNVSTYIEYEIKRTALKRCQSAYLLVDSTKFRGTGLMSYGSLKDMTRIITDKGCPDFVSEYCAVEGIPIDLV